MQTGTVSRLWLCGRSWGLKNLLRVELVRFWKSYTCSNKLDVQETNCCSPQFNRIRNHFFGRRIEVGRSTRTWFVGSDRTEPCLNHEFPREELKNFHTPRIFVFLHGPMTRKVMPRNVWNDIVSWRTRRLSSCIKVATPCLDDHHIKEEEKKDLLENYLLVAHKLFWNVCIWLTKWTKPCDKRLARLISYIHHTSEFRWNCCVGNTAQNAEYGCFKTLILQETLKTQNQNQEDFCVFWEVKHLYPEVGCARNRPRSHTAQQKPSSYLLMRVYAWTEYQLLIFGIWFLKSSTLLQPNQRKPKIKHEETRRVTPNQTSTPQTKLKIQPSTTILSRVLFVDYVSSNAKSSLFGAMLYIFEDNENQKSQGKINVLKNIDCVPSNVQSSRQEALLYVFTDNEVVIKDDHWRKESHNETCIKDPPSCFRLVVWQNYPGLQDSD